MGQGFLLLAGIGFQKQMGYLTKVRKGETNTVNVFAGKAGFTGISFFNKQELGLPNRLDREVDHEKKV